MTRSKAQANAEMRAVTAIREIPEPSEPLPNAARLIWDRLHSSVGPTHFRRGDLAMVERFCIAVVVLRGLERAAMLMGEYDPELVKTYNGMLRSVTGLAGKLRLMPSTRELAKKDNGVDPAEKAKAPRGFLGR